MIAEFYLSTVVWFSEWKGRPAKWVGNRTLFENLLSGLKCIEQGVLMIPTFIPKRDNIVVHLLPYCLRCRSTVGAWEPSPRGIRCSEEGSSWGCLLTSPMPLISSPWVVSGRKSDITVCLVRHTSVAWSRLIWRIKPLSTPVTGEIRTRERCHAMFHRDRLWSRFCETSVTTGCWPSSSLVAIA